MRDFGPLTSGFCAFSKPFSTLVRLDWRPSALRLRWLRDLFEPVLDLLDELLEELLDELLLLPLRLRERVRLRPLRFGLLLRLRLALLELRLRVT